jgi:hypothetical protein
MRHVQSRHDTRWTWLGFPFDYQGDPQRSFPTSVLGKACHINHSTTLSRQLFRSLLHSIQQWDGQYYP